MAYTHEQIINAVHKAERIAQREYRLAHAKQQNYPERIVKDDEQLVDAACADIITDKLAEELLPQARVVIAMRKEREKALEKTTLGQLQKAIEDCLYQSQMSSTLNLTGIRLGENQADWEQFCTALAGGNAVEALEALHLLLASASHSVVTLAMPPLPPSYQVLDKQ